MVRVTQQGLGGNGGSVAISTNKLTLSNGGQISTSTRGSGGGGNVSIAAGTILLDGTGATLPTIRNCCSNGVTIRISTLSSTNGWE